MLLFICIYVSKCSASIQIPRIQTVLTKRIEVAALGHKMLVPVRLLVQWNESWHLFPVLWVDDHFAVHSILVKRSRKDLYSRDELWAIRYDKVQGVVKACRFLN